MGAFKKEENEDKILQNSILLDSAKNCKNPNGAESKNVGERSWLVCFIPCTNQELMISMNDLRTRNREVEAEEEEGETEEEEERVIEKEIMWTYMIHHDPSVYKRSLNTRVRYLQLVTNNYLEVS